MAGGILAGVGLGGFVDGIVFHQLLQWHHLVSSHDDNRPTSLDALEFNVLWDGIFHVATWVATLAGLLLLVASLRGGDGRGDGTIRRVVGLLLLGWGCFDVVDGLVNHVALGLHHLNETVARDQWLLWDLAYIAAGAAIATAGFLLARPRSVRA